MMVAKLSGLQVMSGQQEQPRVTPMYSRLALLSLVFAALAAMMTTTGKALSDTWVYLQVSSHSTQDSAIASAQRYVGEHADVAVHASSSGFYAVTIAYLPQPSARNLLAQLVSAQRIPSDAYLTEGARFAHQVWSSSRDGTATAMPMETAAGTYRDIILEGPVDAYSALMVARQISERPNARRILLNSNGGDSLAGLTIARMVFNAGLDTYIAPQAECYSACAFVFAAGQEKRADGLLGVHQMYSNVESNEFTQTFIAEVLQEMTAYSVPQEVISRMLRTPANDMYVFSPSELDRFGW